MCAYVRIKLQVSSLVLTEKNGKKRTPKKPTQIRAKERLKSWFSVTFNIIISHIFPENFIEFLKSFRKYEKFVCQY